VANGRWFSRRVVQCRKETANENLRACFNQKVANTSCFSLTDQEEQFGEQKVSDKEEETHDIALQAKEHTSSLRETCSKQKYHQASGEVGTIRDHLMSWTGQKNDKNKCTRRLNKVSSSR
jgi:hypothetical protein